MYKGSAPGERTEINEGDSFFKVSSNPRTAILAELNGDLLSKVSIFGRQGFHGEIIVPAIKI